VSSSAAAVRRMAWISASGGNFVFRLLDHHVRPVFELGNE
jgi:hypothetical protein